jgi:AcrR family transcriptional regulator
VPRHRTVTDAEIQAGAARAIARVGPAALTLADVGREVGLSPATLLQRFGSKRGMLLALVADAAEGTRREFAALRAAARSPLGAVRDYAACMAQMAKTPAELANHLAFLQMDLTDPEFHTHALAQSRVARAELGALLDDAVAAGELTPTDTRSLARAVHTIVSGSLVAWAIHRQGTAARWVARDLEAVLAPYLLKSV